ncbi:MAG: FxLYD domain-containing protein, partial [Acetobacterium sp.]|nr:FxLYD domain-containing protein [Acetobacterium sp.]
MKKYVILCLVISLFSLLLLGCQNASSASIDEQFMKSMTKGLEARWAISTDPSNANIANGTTEHRAFNTKMVDAELSELSQYEDKEFENAALQALAMEYIGLLNTQKDSLEDVVSDFDKYNEIWMAAFNKRSQLIEQFVNNYGLKVSDKYTETLNDMMKNSENVTAAEQEKSAIQAMLSAMQFEIVDDSSSWKKYQTTAVNISGTDFTNFSLTINLMDGEGAILGTTYASVANWTNEQKANFE